MALDKNILSVGNSGFFILGGVNMYRMAYDSADRSIKNPHLGYAFLLYPLLHRGLYAWVIIAITVPFFLAASPKAAVVNNPAGPNDSLTAGGEAFFDGDDKSANLASFAQSARESSSQFGSARFQFNADDDFHLNGSSVDLLVPFDNRPNTMLFTQLSGRHRDSRNTLNLGAGARLFTNNWMFGLNSFFDNDFSGTNRRMSLGAELWTHYVKLSSNLYYRIKNWSHSPDLENFDERPAFGYDMRGDAYLPFFPQLGARMVFEKYYGDGVALFDKNKRLDSPRALIVGLDYTPIPLLTLAVEQRVGSGDQSEDRITLQINYRLGLSWREQFNPRGVASLRTLDLSRYDSVERNGDMVLDYRR